MKYKIVLTTYGGVVTHPTNNNKELKYDHRNA